MKKILMGILLLGISYVGQADVIEMGHFDDFSNSSGLQLNGTAKKVNNDKVLRFGRGGSAFTRDTISLANDTDFSTKFTFNFNNQYNGGADGLMFIMQSLNSNVGGVGGGMGFKGLNNSIGIEFDNWKNGGYGDISRSHIGINIDGNMRSTVAVDTFALGLGDLDNSKINWTAWIDYDGQSDLLEVFFNDQNLKPSESVLSHTVDIASLLGGPNSYLGFSGATGWAGANQDVLSWEYASSTNISSIHPDNNVKAVPEPDTFMMLGLSLILFIVFGFLIRPENKARISG